MKNEGTLDKFGKKYAVLYIRVSTDGEAQDSSYQEQYNELEKYAKQKGFTVIRVYKERITATKITGRDEFEKLIRDIEHREFDAVIFKDLSRSARNIEVSARLKRICLENQVGIYSVTEGDHLELETLNYNLKAMLNEHYSTDLSIKIKSRFRSRMEKGEFLKGQATYGYYVKDYKLYIRDDDTPNIVKRIYNEYLAGHGVDSIAKRLTEDGIVTPSMLKKKKDAGVRWHGSTVKLILENRAYCGDLEQGKEETASAISKKRIVHEQGIIVENTHEPIISKEMFMETQNLIASRKKGPRPTPRKHLFTDILLCGECGKKYWYRSYGDRYVCGSYGRHGKKACSAHAVKESVIKKIIIDELNAIIKKHMINEQIDEKIDSHIKNRLYKVKNEMTILKEKIEKYEEAKAELIVSKVMKEITPVEYDVAVKRIEKTIAEIEQRISKLESANLKVDRLKVQKQLKNVFLGTDSFDDLDRETLFRFVEHIIVHGKNDFEIVYRFSL